MTDNELIAEFMGYKKDSSGLYLIHSHAVGRLSSLFSPDHLAYNTSWDWLMPVCQKISSLKPITIYKNGTESITDWINKQRKMRQGAIQFDIIICFSGVVEFIKWYNENKTITK